jgi:hypothetical protein
MPQDQLSGPVIHPEPAGNAFIKNKVINIRIKPSHNHNKNFTLTYA